ncbi:pyrimidine dimer DNA glycosylase/endonuclease V [Georgenia soli]|uniref:pyrimidine dimer DNA glycosylase/endonuclease V n=1 Tax=Georgenia soli TaxID=638953 RepID=UPI000BF52F0A|nr:pyrimidine dimer DNA glycosylase/endonuclease V [Georgenia soli]
MRLWSLHPQYLDRQGLTACWREALLAQAVLAGRTKGYRHHPQLVRFRAHAQPLAAVGAYLSAVADEATTRGYRYDRGRILVPPAADVPTGAPIAVTEGQLDHEWTHLMTKLSVRSPDRARELAGVAVPLPHPLFVVEPGPVADWEVVTR